MVSVYSVNLVKTNYVFTLRNWYVYSLGLEDGGKATLANDVQHLVVVDAIHRKSKMSQRGPKSHKWVQYVTDSLFLFLVT